MKSALTFVSAALLLAGALTVPAKNLASLRDESPEATGQAPKPILEGFTADPSIRVFGDTYYIYPTTDRPNWNTTEFAVWSSKNLVTWKKEGVFLDISRDLTWATNKAWAPDCIERDGKYYFYFCANHNIGVAIGDTPIGPFKDALGRPLIEDAKIKTFSIDPHAFIDDDGQAYLYFGNGTPTVYKLNRDMISFDGPPVEFKLKEFREGIVVFKRAGKYYFMWSIDDARSPNYRVGWGIADSPFGPVKSPEKDFIVLEKNGPAVATAHHGVVNVPGTDRWYVAYHRHAIPDGSGYKRQVCLARMEFNADGGIKPMDPMTTPFQPGDFGEPVTSCVLDPEKSQGVWDGWGTSLCWFANVFGDRDDVAAILFSTQSVQLDDQSLPGLGMNIVRYNAGACSTNAVDGQEIVLSRAIPSWKQIEGFWLDGKSEDPRTASWNWSADAKQRALMIKARDHGADRFELFSNSPMWWMLANRNPSGAAKATDDNLPAENHEKFAVYLAAIAKYARDNWGITFTTVEPFNEPCSDYWSARNGQEGCHFSRPAQAAVLRLLRAELNERGLTGTEIAASDESKYDWAVETWNSLDAPTRALINQVNVHGYQHDKGDREALSRLVRGKRLWNSEYGDGDAQGLNLSRDLHLDFRLLRPTAWAYWQPLDGGGRGGWGLLPANMRQKTIGKANPKYFVLAQYSRHIRPGMLILSTGENETVAAFDPKRRKLVLVAQNLEASAREKVYDLSKFALADGAVKCWRTEPKGDTRYEPQKDAMATSRRLQVSLPPYSIQTFELENAAAK